MGRPSIKTCLPYAVAAAALVLVVAVGYSLWSEVRERFPKLPAGSYLGAIDGIFAQDGGAEVRFYIEAIPEKEDILFLLLKAGAQPVLSAMAAPGGSAGESEYYFPLTVRCGDIALKLTGALTEGGYYGGTAENLSNLVKGSWWLKPVREASEETRRRESEVELWLAAKIQLEDLESEIVQAERRVPELKAEIEKLSDYVTEGKSLKQKADQKLAAVRGTLREAQDKLHARQEEAQQLEARIELSQRVTGMGKLVSLSRETLDRERRWLNSMFSGSPGGSDLDEAVARASAVLELKKAIALEEDRIARLTAFAAAEPGKGEQP